MIHLGDRITVCDFLDAGACIEGVCRFVAKTKNIAGPVADLTGEAKKFFDSPYSKSYAYGDAEDCGYGYAYGDAYIYGDGIGHGYAYGDAYIHGDGHGDYTNGDGEGQEDAYGI